MPSFEQKALIPRESMLYMLYKVSRTPKIIFGLHRTPPSSARVAPGTFCAAHEKHLSERRDRHDARTAQRDAHQHTQLEQEMRIGPTFIHRGQGTSERWPQQCLLQCTVDPQRHREISLPPQKGSAFGLTLVANAAVHLATCHWQCRLSALGTHSARAKAVRSGFVTGGGVNGAMRAEKRSNGVGVCSPATERPIDQQLEGGFKL